MDSQPPQKFSSDLQEITVSLISRIKSGHSALSNYETMLLTYIEKNKDTVHPALILEICKYYRISINAETKAVLDFVSKSKPTKEERSSPVPTDLLKEIEDLPEDSKGVIVSALSINK